jgi:hypothetical protein
METKPEATALNRSDLAEYLRFPYLKKIIDDLEK